MKLRSISLALAFVSICGFAWAASQSDKDLAAARAQIQELKAQIAASMQREATDHSLLVKLQSMMGDLAKDASVSTKSSTAGLDAAANAVTAAKQTAAANSNAVAGVQSSADSIQLQLEELRSGRSANNAAVLVAAIAAVGALITALGSIALALINHMQVSQVKQQTNGVVSRIATLSEEKGRADVLAEQKRDIRT